MEVKEVSSQRCFGGWQRVFKHPSDALGVPMNVGVYLPPGADSGERPVLFYLSGLTCTEQNVITKAGAQRYCAQHGLILVTPDTSPRGEDVPDDEGWDLGQGAGFYLTATEEPWAEHYQMERYVAIELPALVQEHFSHSRALGVTGHSMGGLGAITLALNHSELFRSISALAPIVQPRTVPWGIKAFTAYLGNDRATWARYDPSVLIGRSDEKLPILIDQGTDDPFLDNQLRAAAFLTAAEVAGYPVVYRKQEGYDHSYYFVASFIGDHIAHHARALKG